MANVDVGFVVVALLLEDIAVVVVRVGVTFR